MPLKDPDEIADYGVNWAPQLAAGDVLEASEWIVPAGITVDRDDFDDNSTTVWLSGGTDGERYALVNRVTTTGGRTLDQPVQIQMRGA